MVIISHSNHGDLDAIWISDIFFKVISGHMTSLEVFAYKYQQVRRLQVRSKWYHCVQLSTRFD